MNEPNFEVYGDARSGFSAHCEQQRMDLRPCPFCGGGQVEVTNTHTVSYWAACVACGAEIHGAWHYPKAPRSRAHCLRVHRKAFASAVQAWQRRVKPVSEAALESEPWRKQS